MNTETKVYVEDEVSAAFQNGSIFKADDDKLDKYLRWLASAPVPNDLIRHVQIIRGLTINTIKTDRYIKQANRQNTIHTYIIFGLTALAIVVSIISVSLSVQQSHNTAQQIERLIDLQAKEVKLLKNAASEGKNESRHLRP